MSVKTNTTGAKITSPKLNITVKDATIFEGKMVDEDGCDIVKQIDELLPDYVETFSFKISVDLMDEYEA